MTLVYEILCVLAMCAASFLGGVKVQTWHNDSQEKARVEAQAETDRIAHIADIKRQDRVILAQNAAAGRALVAQRDAADARTELDRMLHAADDSIAAAKLSHAACIDNATSLKDVLGVCEGERGELARKADGHVNDIQTLVDAWPTK